MGSQLASSSRHTITGIHLLCRWWAAVSLDAVLLLRRGLRGPRMPSETNVRLQKKKKKKSLFVPLEFKALL